MQPIGLRRSDFQAIGPELRPKKIAGRFERSARLLRLMNVGAVIPPIGCIRRERPSTPSAPYSLTRPVVPPDGSFISGADFRKPLRTPAPFRLAAGVPRQPTGHSDILLRISNRNCRGQAPQCGHAAARLDAGWGKLLRAGAGFFNRCALRRRTHWTTTKFSTEYPYCIQLIRPGCVCVRLSPWG
jgi:hypothetical protein